MNIKEGDIVALPSVDKKRVIFVYRVYKVSFDRLYRRKHLLKWRNNINSVYEIERRRYTKNQQLYAENKRLLVNDEIPQDIINDFLIQEEKEISAYEQKLKSLIDRAMDDIEKGYLPSLFIKYDIVHYYLEKRENELMLREEIHDFEDRYELIDDLKSLGYVNGNNMISYASLNYDFKRPNDEYIHDLNVKDAMNKFRNFGMHVEW